MKYVTIKGINFELQKEKLTMKDVSMDRFGVDENEIYQRYGKPSWRKVGIWNSWVSWFNMNAQGPNDYLTIRSATCHFFSISGLITVVENCERKKYRLHITYAHNIAWEIV